MKNAVKRGTLGAVLGIAISTVISLVISAAIGDGTYYAVVPQLVGDCGTELYAVLLQYALSMLYGAAWGAASVIWEKDEWSILRMTVTHLVICSAATLPIAWFLRWMEHSVSGVAGYFAIFIGIYAVIWLTQYSAMKKRVAELNSELESMV